MAINGSDQTEMLIPLTSKIVAAHVKNNIIAVDEVPALINNVYGALFELGLGSAQEEPAPEPAVSLRSSVKNGYIICLDCGKKMKMLKRHLMTEHGMTVDEYRARWDLRADYPVVAPDYADMRRNLAKAIGLGRKPGQRRGRRKKAE